MNTHWPKYLLLAFIFLCCSSCDLSIEHARTGDYRAVITLAGNELPLQLKIAQSQQQLQLWTRNAQQWVAATEVVEHDGQLQAVLAQGYGTLDVAIYRRSLKGSLTLQPPNEPVIKLPLQAQYDVRHRFFIQPATDNADISGRWQLHCTAPSTTLALELTQSHDQVDGVAQLTPAIQLNVMGQVYKDRLQLGLLGAGHALLLKAAVDPTGTLTGQLFTATQAVSPCNATHIDPSALTTDL